MGGRSLWRIGRELSAAEGPKETRFAAVHRLEACTLGDPPPCRVLGLCRPLPTRLPLTRGAFSAGAPPDYPLSPGFIPGVGHPRGTGIEFRGLHTCPGGAVRCPPLQTLTESRHRLRFKPGRSHAHCRQVARTAGTSKYCCCRSRRQIACFCRCCLLFGFGQGITECSNEKSLHCPIKS